MRSMNIPCPRLCSLCWMHTEVLANFQLHAVDLCKKAGNRCSVIGGIGLGLTQLGHLLLEPRNTVEGGLKLLVIGDHGFSLMISTMPRRPPSRRTCQYSIMLCSPPMALDRRVQNMLAPKCVSAAIWSKIKAASPTTVLRSNVSSINKTRSMSLGSGLEVTNEPKTMKRAI